MGSTDAEVSILFTDDAEIRELNRIWRGLDRCTDVLSFSQEEGPPTPETGARFLGDIVISVPTALRQSRTGPAGLQAELQRLLIHGVLHLLGHDHVRGGPRAKHMRAEERRLWRLLAPRPPRRKIAPGKRRRPA